MDSLGRQRYAEIFAAAGLVEPVDLSELGREVLELLARAGEPTVAGVCNLVAAAYRAGYEDGDDAADRYVDGVPFFRHDETVTVTVSPAELVAHGMPDPAVIGVVWELGDECIAHALAGAARRAEAGPDDRGMLLYRGWRVDCLMCRAEADQ